MKIIIIALLGLSLLMVVSYGLSQAWLAYSYGRSKSKAFALMPKPIWHGKLPSVLIQLPIFNERYVVERLLNAISKIDYPRELLSIQLLDDSNDGTSDIAALAIARIIADGGPVIDHIRRPERKGFKAGALEYGLKLSKAEFVAVFDADFVPQPEFVKAVIPYFSHLKIGMVQTRWTHINAEYSVLTRMMAYAIDNHFSVEQGGRQATGAFINFNGTAGIWRRRVIDEAGGWNDDCLTEDLDLSFRAQLQGWQFLFVEDVATPSELPVEMQAIRNQQARWTKGAAETTRKNIGILWRSNQRLYEKVIGSFHMLNSTIYAPLLVLGLASAAALSLDPETYAQVAFVTHCALALSVFSIGFTYWTSRARGGFAGPKENTFKILATTGLFVIMVAGLCIGNSKALWLGLIGKTTAFVRTAKFNVSKLGKASASANSDYRATDLPFEFYLEVLCVGLFGWVIYYAVSNGIYGMLDIYAFYLAGFVLVVFFSLRGK